MTPLETAWRELAQCAVAINPSRVIGSPDAIDVNRFIDDLELVERRFVLLLNANRDHACENFSGIDSDYFKSVTDVMSDAMSDLRFHLTKIAEGLDDQEREREADPRGFARAEMD